MSDVTAHVATGEWFVDILSSVKILVTDAEHIERALTDEWRKDFYNFGEVDDVLKHLSFNCAVNDVEDASRLDGWGDLPKGALTMNLERMVEFERVVNPGGR